MISLRPELKSNGLVSTAFSRNNVKICTKITTILFTYWHKILKDKSKQVLPVCLGFFVYFKVGSTTISLVTDRFWKWQGKMGLKAIASWTRLFSSFFAIFDDFSKTSSKRRRCKNFEKLSNNAKNEEKSGTSKTHFVHPIHH